MNHADILSIFRTLSVVQQYMHLRTTKPTTRLRRPAKAQISLRVRGVWSDSSLIACAFYKANLVIPGGCTGWTESFWPHRSYCRFFSCAGQRMTKPTKWHVRPAKTKISLGIYSVWSESSLPAWRKFGSLATHWAHSEDSDQIGRMPRLIRVFAGRTCYFVGFVTLIYELDNEERYFLIFAP